VTGWPEKSDEIVAGGLTDGLLIAAVALLLRSASQSNFD